MKKLLNLFKLNLQLFAEPGEGGDGNGINGTQPSTTPSTVNIDYNKIEEMLKDPKCTFVLYVGTKKLVKRKEFEQFVSKSLEI